MASETEIEIARALREVQTKHVYFLLTAAGAGVALAVNQTQGSGLTWSLLPLAIAVVCWGLSFVCGCWYVRGLASGLYGNSSLLEVQSGRHPMIGANPHKAQVVTAAIADALEEASQRGGRYFRCQFRLLATGAVLYVAWRILGMYLRT
jgi:hypothetical protein